MNCRNCGSPLPDSEVAFCPRCGTPAFSNNSPTGTVTPDSPTIRTYQPSPSVSHSAHPLEASDSTEALTLPARRRSNRLAVFSVVLLLILLISGGGAFAWFKFSPGSDSATSTIAVTVQATVTTQAKFFTASGTSTIVQSKTITTQTDGENKIYTIVQQATTSGGIAGSITTNEISTYHSDQTSTFSGKSTCTCTVSGKSGMLTWSVSGTQAADGTFQGQFFGFQGTNGLTGLHGQGVFQGSGSNDTYSAELSFT